MTESTRRILMINYEFPPLGGGGGVAAKKLAQGFIDLGYQVDFLTTAFKDLPNHEKVDGINVYRAKVLGRHSLFTANLTSLISFPFCAYNQACQLAKSNQYDFISTFFAVPTGILGVWISKKYKLSNILSILGGDIYDPTKDNSPHKKWYLRKIVSWVLNNSDKVVAESHNIKDNALKYYKVNKDIRVIPLAYQLVKFKELSRQELNLETNKFYLISVGRLVKRKGFDFLIRSLVGLDKNIESIIIGDGPEKNNLVDLAKKLGIQSRVKLLGSISGEKKFQYLANADVYVLPSVHEGFGIVLQEAMQVGLPIIATNNGGQVDLIAQNKNGLLVNYNNSKQLSSAIIKLFEDQNMCQLMAVNNKAKINNYSPQNIVGQYIKLLY